jgi:hypothetical protein
MLRICSVRGVSMKLSASMALITRLRITARSSRGASSRGCALGSDVGYGRSPEFAVGYESARCRVLRISATIVGVTAGAIFPQLLRIYVATSAISWSVNFHAKLGMTNPVGRSRLIPIRVPAKMRCSYTFALLEASSPRNDNQSLTGRNTRKTNRAPACGA